MVNFESIDKISNNPSYTYNWMLFPSCHSGL